MQKNTKTMSPVKVFFSYSHQDERLREELEKHLIILQRQGVISGWNDRRIDAGDKWYERIEEELNEADIILLLVSADFLASDFCYNVELKKAIKRHENGEATVIPIILRTVSWQDTPFGSLQALPKDGKPVTSWQDQDRAFNEIATGIRNIANKIQIIRSSSLSRDKEIKLSQDIGINEILSELDENQRKDYPYLVNVTSSFDQYDALIDSLVSTASNYPGKVGKNLPVFYLDVLKRAFSAEIVYLCSVEENNSEVLFASSKENHSDSIDPKRIHDEIIRFYPRIFKIRSPVHIPLDINFHLFQNVPCSLIPLRTDEKSSDLLVVYNYSIGTKLLDLTMGTILQALYEGSKHFQKKTGANELKIAVADKLKQTFNYVSEKLFNFRLNLFKDALKTIEMYFEPILQFDKLNEGVSIWGWEALARHKITKKVPVDILRGAEFWGLHFQTELDMYCLEHAVQKYYDENRKLKNFRYGEIKPLTVNVFPNTILRTAYQKLLDDLIKKDKLMPKNTLVLEISEKTLIQALTPSEEEIFLQDFQKRMQRLKKQYGINFAIDDFGVGNSSIARLNKLLPGYVKIDRDILHYDHDLGKQLIKYVNSVAENVPGIGVHIVIEGLDDHSKISLPELIYELDIEYVQGHKFSQARPVIAIRLEKEIYRDIYEKLQWEFNS